MNYQETQSTQPPSKVQAGQDFSIPGLHVRDSVFTDAKAIGDNIRDADREELSAVFDMPPTAWVITSLDRSVMAKTIVLKDEPIAVFGVSESNHDPDTGIPWLIGTDKLPGIAKTFLKECPNYVLKMHQHFPVLNNFVHVKNTIAHLWLKKLGFYFYPAEPYGEQQELFYPFVRIQNV